MDAARDVVVQANARRALWHIRNVRGDSALSAACERLHAARVPRGWREAGELKVEESKASLQVRLRFSEAGVQLVAATDGVDGRRLYSPPSPSIIIIITSTIAGSKAEECG